MSMARDLEKKGNDFEQCVLALTTVMETAKVCYSLSPHCWLVASVDSQVIIGPFLGSG